MIKCDASHSVQLSFHGADYINLHSSSSGNTRNSNENGNYNLACVSAWVIFFVTHLHDNTLLE